MIATDWDSDRERLRETRCKWKWRITAVQTYFMVLVCVVFSLGLVTDLSLGRLDASQAIVVGLWTVTAGISAGIALTSFHGGQTIVIFNNILSLDRPLKGMD